MSVLNPQATIALLHNYKAITEKQKQYGEIITKAEWLDDPITHSFIGNYKNHHYYLVIKNIEVVLQENTWGVETHMALSLHDNHRMAKPLCKIELVEN